MALAYGSGWCSTLLRGVIMPNKELRNALHRAKTLTAESKNRIHFALVLKGSTEGILIAGSGGIVHNLRTVTSAYVAIRRHGF